MAAPSVNCAGNGHMAFFQRLAHGFDPGAFELGHNDRGIRAILCEFRLTPT